MVPPFAAVSPAPADPMPAVEFAAIGKRFGHGPWVIDGLNLEVRAGEFITFLGPSGCGKSTLLRLLSGLSEPTTGAIRFDGTEARPPLAYIFQEATLLPWLTVQQNIEVPLRLAGAERAERVSRTLELAKLVGLGDALQLHPRQLSGGMQMRVSLARALTQQPRLLLLDEPFGALDALTRNRLNEELLALRERDRWTAFFVTHSVSEAVFLSSRIVLLGTRPARVAKIIEVPLPYPRTPATREDIAYQHLVARTNAELRQILPHES